MFRLSMDIDKLHIHLKYLYSCLFVAASCLVFTLSISVTIADADEAYMIKCLKQSIGETPYSALIKHTGVEVIPLPDDKYVEKHLYKANVLETYRGRKMKQIQYFMVVEKGEDAIVRSKPCVITLCTTENGFYWPGVGATFPATPNVLKTAREISKTLPAEQKKYPDCE